MPVTARPTCACEFSNVGRAQRIAFLQAFMLKVTQQEDLCIRGFDVTTSMPLVVLRCCI